MLNFNWDRLDTTAAKAIVNLINGKLGDIVAERNERVTKSTADPLLLEDVRVDSLDWGSQPPYVEVLDIKPAVELAAACLSPVPTADSLRSTPSRASQPPGSLPFSPAPTSRHSQQRRGSTTGATASMSDSTSDVMSSSPNPTPAISDTLASFIGPSGLYLAFHVTYGGYMRLQCSATATKAIHIGPACALAGSMPLRLSAQNSKLDFFLHINLHRNTCSMWLTPGPSDTILGELSVVATIGDSDDPEEVCVDHSAVGELLTTEIRAIIQHKLVAPHYVSFPVVLPGGSESESPSLNSTPRGS